ncbi:hypothetical protein [Leptothrix cholodnii]|nr:hypothetical protein [Leptothrix cholodnii]
MTDTPRSRPRPQPASQSHRRHRGMARAALSSAVLLLAACAGGPPPPAWQGNARQALDRAVEAHLSGDSRAEAQDFARARSEIARTGNPALMARAELIRCAAQVAGLMFGPCEGFERLRADADPAGRAYADHLAAMPLSADDIAHLPSAQRDAAAAVASARRGGRSAPGPSAASLQKIDDPLARLIAVAVLFQAGQASPAVIAVAADTASAQGWRRPLLAWLNVQAQRAENAGDSAEAQRLRRRIELVRNDR